MAIHKMDCPGFFRFFIPEWYTEQLTLPSNFTDRIRGKLPKKVVLSDRCHNYWQVKVGKVGDSMCLQDGWFTYIKDNLLESGDLIVFNYISDGLFNVKVLDTSGLEKQIARKYIFKEIEWQKNFPKENETGEHIELVSDDDVEIKEENEEREDNEEERPEEDVEVVDKHDADIEEEENTEIGGEDVVGEGVLLETSRQKRSRNIYGEELFLSGLAIQPKNPYFVSRTTQRKSELHVPMDFVKNRSIDYENVTYLVDPMNTEWKIKFKKLKDGGISYGGWRRFFQCNFVDKDDTCICEFAEGNRGPYIKVSIIRACQSSTKLVF